MLKTAENPSTRYGDQTIIDGSLVVGTAGKGIDFSADAHAAHPPANGVLNMAHRDEDDEGIVPIIRKLPTWPFLSMAIMLAVNVGSFYTSSQSQKGALAAISAKLDAALQDQTEQKIALAELRAVTNSAKVDITDLRGRVFILESKRR